eukprot:1325274-Pyramimonas_sp.AAC.1
MGSAAGLSSPPRSPLGHARLHLVCVDVSATGLSGPPHPAMTARAYTLLSRHHDTLRLFVSHSALWSAAGLSGPPRPAKARAYTL